MVRDNRPGVKPAEKPERLGGPAADAMAYDTVVPETLVLLVER
jgi:hypothetical protein